MTRPRTTPALIAALLLVAGAQLVAPAPAEAQILPGLPGLPELPGLPGLPDAGI